MSALDAEPLPVGNEGRWIAAWMVRQLGVNEQAIAEVLAEPLTPETEGWQILQWTDRMRGITW